MKRRGGDGGRRTMVFDKKETERRTSETMEMEALCSELTSLIPQEYRLDTAAQGSSDVTTQLMQATNYIKDLRERVERLKQRRDDFRSENQRTTSSGSSTAATGSCGPHDITVQFSGATHFDVNLTTSSRKSVEMHKLISTIQQDQRIEVIEARSSFVDDSKNVYRVKCRALGSEAVLDASMVAARLRRLLAESFEEPDRRGLEIG